VGVFVLFVMAVICTYVFADLYQGNLIRTAKFYQKPMNSCAMCLLIYGMVAIILFKAPRATVEEDQDTNKVDTQFVLCWFNVASYLYVIFKKKMCNSSEVSQISYTI
jgi:hypothetical protein